MAGQTRVLVVDRDSANRRLLLAALQAWNPCTIVEADDMDALKAIPKKIENLTFVVIDPGEPCDRSWADLSDLCRQLPNIPVVILSNYFNQQAVGQAFKAGAVDYLKKPVDLRELRRTIKLVRQQMERDAEARHPEHRMHVRLEDEGMFVELVAPTHSPHIERFQNFVHRLMIEELPKDEYLNLRLALEETVTNAMEWGNKGDRDKIVKISYCLLPDRVTLRIEDEGGGFNPIKVPDPTIDPLKHLEYRKSAGKRIGGWGIYLTRKAMDHVDYNDRGNVVRLTKYLKGRGVNAHKPDGDAQAEADDEAVET